MSGELPTTVRLVRCPRCRLVLRESPNFTVYKCGGCGTILQAKTKKVEINSLTSGAHDDLGSSQESQSGHVSEEQGTSNSNANAIFPSSIVSESDGNKGEENKSSDRGCPKLQGADLAEEQSNGIDQCQDHSPSADDDVISAADFPSVKLADQENTGPVAMPDCDVMVVRVNDQSSHLTNANSDLAISKEFVAKCGSSSNDELKPSRSSVHISHESIGESLLERPTYALDEQEEQPRNNICCDVEHGSVVDADGAEHVDQSSELSGAIQRMTKSTKTRSSLAYEGSVSSYDGNDDSAPNRHLSSSENVPEVAIFSASKERRRKDKFLIKSVRETDSNMQDQGGNSQSNVVSRKKLNPMRYSRWDQNDLSEGRYSGSPRNWAHLDWGEFPSSEATYAFDPKNGYDSGNTSNSVYDKRLSDSGFHLSEKSMDTEFEKMKLLRMVCALQDQLKKTCNLNGRTNGIASSGMSWKETRSMNRQKYSAAEEEVWEDFNNHRYLGRYRPESQWLRQQKISRIAVPPDANNGRHQSDFPWSSCFSQDYQFSNQLFPHAQCYNEGISRVQPGHKCCSPYSSCTSSPHWYRSSEFHRTSHLTEYIDNQNHHEVENYLRERHPSIKKHLRPIAGGAPFIICYNCFKPLQLPGDFLLFRRRFHRVRCGACSEVLKFSLEDRIRIMPYTASGADPQLSEGDEHCDAVNMVYLDDYGPSFCRSCSTEGDHVPPTPIPSLQGNLDDRNISSVPFDEPRRDGKNEQEIPMGEFVGPSYTLSKSDKLSSAMDDPQPASTSPLHRLMGYSSPSEVIYGPSEAQKQKRT